MKLNARASQLVIIDMQEKLMPVIADGEQVVNACGQLLEGAKALDVPFFVYEQYRKGLGATVSPLLEKAGNAPVLEKMHFSCARDADMLALMEERARNGARQCVLAGVEAHVCVIQTALDLKARGLEVFVAGDAISSRRPAHADSARMRMQGHGIETLPVESILFEWLEKSGGKVFKQISQLVK